MVLDLLYNVPVLVSGISLIIATVWAVISIKNNYKRK